MKKYYVYLNNYQIFVGSYESLEEFCIARRYHLSMVPLLEDCFTEKNVIEFNGEIIERKQSSTKMLINEDNIYFDVYEGIDYDGQPMYLTSYTNKLGGNASDFITMQFNEEEFSKEYGAIDDLYEVHLMAAIQKELCDFIKLYRDAQRNNLDNFEYLCYLIKIL